MNMHGPMREARTGFYSPADLEKWNQLAHKRRVDALRQEIALAINKRDRLNESIEDRKKSLARLEAQAVFTAPVVSAPCMSAAICS